MIHNCVLFCVDRHLSRMMNEKTRTTKMWPSSSLIVKAVCRLFKKVIVLFVSIASYQCVCYVDVLFFSSLYLFHFRIPNDDATTMGAFRTTVLHIHVLTLTIHCQLSKSTHTVLLFPFSI